MQLSRDNIIVAGLLASMIVAAGVFVYLPQAKRLGELQMKIATERADLDAKIKQAVVVPDFVRHIQTMRERYSDFHNRLPRSKELGGFLAEISRLLTSENLNTHYKVGTPSKKELFITLPINMSLTGSYKALGRLLININKMKRFTRVQRLLLVNESSENNVSDKLTIELQLNIYFITEDDELDSGAKYGV